MQDTLENVISTFGSAIVAPGLGSAEFLVAILVACGFILIAIASLLPKDEAGNLEWWER